MKVLITGANSLVNKALLAKLVDMGYEVTAHYHTENDLTTVSYTHLTLPTIYSV